MSRKMRLGPIAIFLTVVAIVLTTLAMLTQATSHADLVMARRFALVTETRYALEEEGQRYMMEVDGMIEDGSFSPEDAGMEKKKNGHLIHTISKDDYDLTIEITDPGRSGKYEIVKWKLSRRWAAEDPYGNIWQGPAGK
jgi:hypothetical protein